MNMWMLALCLGLLLAGCSRASIGIIGGADGPTEIVVDVTPMNLRDRIQISAVPRPAGCEFVYGTDFLVAEIIPPRS